MLSNVPSSLEFAQLSHNPPEKIKTYIHLKSIQRQIKQLSNPVCLGQETIKNLRLAWLELLPSFPPITEQGVGHSLLCTFKTVP